MNGRDVIQTSLGMSKHVLMTYLSDLGDADLLVRPAPAANHIAWQLGHLISAEIQLLTPQASEFSYPELPAGFVEAHAKATSGSDTGFATRAEYVRLFEQVRAATQAGLARLEDADLDRKTQGPMAAFAPTLGAMLVLVAQHTLMHAGQFAVVRRLLGKPVLI